MKTIGFIDYRLDEWHANNYPRWIQEACSKLGLEWKLGYAWAEESAPEGLLTTAEWCAKFGAMPATSIDEVCEKSDALLILAPTNPEKHLPYAQAALKYGKPTYIDKTFAPDAATAQRIFDLAAQYGAPMFSTSALRCASELADFAMPHSAFVTGGGSNLPEYAIHLVEMIICLMGTQWQSVRCDGNMDHLIAHIGFDGGRSATLIYGANMPYTLDVQAEAGTMSQYAPVKSAFFPALIEGILNFYESGRPPVDKAQTMACMTLRDALLDAVV